MMLNIWKRCPSAGENLVNEMLTQSLIDHGRRPSKLWTLNQCWFYVGQRSRRLVNIYPKLVSRVYGEPTLSQR